MEISEMVEHAAQKAIERAQDVIDFWMRGETPEAERATYARVIELLTPSATPPTPTATPAAGEEAATPIPTGAEGR